MYREDELLPLSGLQHLLFCERQCALMYVERLWADNALTLDGTHRHKRVHEEGASREVRGDTVILRGLWVRSLELGVVGRPDVVELHRVRGDMELDVHEGKRPPAVEIKGLDGLFCPFPVEYKRGRAKKNASDAAQLCAQAVCLEEMLDVAVGRGALFYGRQRKRFPVVFDRQLRATTTMAAARFHALVDGGETPLAPKEPKCEKCSLLFFCVPEAMAKRRAASEYVAKQLRSIEGRQEQLG